ncbi:hypothetical protein N1031_05450 [Herbiconiux moechotypicola]|uniref:DUF4352 domain-containing protein n=1 Tax=Herbiconiux moechotypicola TaxID=637393 RepID=A0ABP5Q7R3_9MICO|nr:hypothetical protein [Herbiconiux moechotypicola]MCS5729201.1 hypothetical protein [Herbiconiux moechotypicola]
MTTPTERPPADEPKAAATRRAAAGGVARPGIGTRARALGDKVPTKWLVSGLFAVFLACSALFGGLETAAVTPPPALAAGEPYSGAQLRIAVERAALIDGFPEQYIEPETEGNRLLVVVATVENLWRNPASTISNIGAADNLRPVGVAGLDAASEPLTVAVLNDGAEYPELQTGVPIELAFIWEVTPDAVADGDEIAVDVYDKSYRADGFVTSGERWENPVVAATVTLEVADVGAGVTEDDQAENDQADGSDG